jgi:hypothetical protein
MRKINLLLALLLILLAPSLYAQNKFNINDRVQSNNSGVNVRVNPGTNQTSVGTLRVWDKGTVTSGSSAYTTGYYWYKVNFDKGIQGWVAQDFLNAQSFEVPTGPFIDSTNYVPPRPLKNNIKTQKRVCKKVPNKHLLK